jgi:hypothetical protein
MTQMPVEFLMAKLWYIYFPLIQYGDKDTLIRIYKELDLNRDYLPPIKIALKDELVKKLAKYGIDTDFIY